MSPPNSRAVPALGALLLCASTANAQTAGTGGGTSGGGQGGIAVNAITIGGEEVTLEGVKLGIAECQQNVTLVFELDGVPGDKESIDIYIGERCDETDRNNIDVNRCNYLTTLDSNEQTQDLRLEVMARDLFRTTSDSDENPCDAEREAEPTLWFLAVDTPESAEDVGNGFGTFDYLVDTRRPDPPGNVRGGTGEHDIRISWDTDEAGLRGFRIYIDNNPTTGGDGGTLDGGGPASTGDCGSSVLVPGDTPDEVPEGVIRREHLRENATGYDLDTSLIDGDRAAVAVVALDEANNESPLSNIGCVRVEPTTGFWDRYRANGGQDVSGCPCSTLGPAQVQSAWPVALSLLFLARSARRRRNS